MKTHYETLGVPKTATPAEIKSAYRSLALKYHPDQNPGASETYMRIKEAYEILSEPASRAEYDRSLTGARETPKSTASTSEPRSARTSADPFRDILNNMRGEGQRNVTQDQKPDSAAAVTATFDLEISPGELARGTSRLIRVEGKVVRINIKGRL